VSLNAVLPADTVIPYRIETLFQHEPWANKLLFGGTIVASLVLECRLLPEEVVRQYFIWGEGGPLSLLGYQFAHAGLAHLAGNMVFLWVFGNAVCATVGNWTYLGLYLGLGAFAGLVHTLVGGEPVVGASGSIAGVVGLAVAFYPVNKVNLFYSLGLVPRTGRIWLWILALYWSFWDVVGALFHLGPVAYWAHIGGTAAGLATGLGLLALGKVTLTEFDNGSLLDFILRRVPPHKAQPLPATPTAGTGKMELQRAAKACLEDYAAKPSPCEMLNRTIGPRKIQLHRTAMPQAPASVPTPSSAHASPTTEVPSVRFGATTSAPLRLSARKAAPVRHNSAWPATLPEVRYFYFDGTTQRGPIDRAEFLQTVSLAPSTERWWYWAEGMESWQRVSNIGESLTVVRSTRSHQVVQHLG
jgi:membrane associated rhomboid family serine protease